jgi:predicted ATPase/DNA-binding CsgD family transcriptional regulator
LDIEPTTPLHAVPSSRGRAADARLTRQGRSDLEIRPHNLLPPLTSFIGRGQELAEVRQLLHATRLLTLTGTGGVGKTRLGYQVAASLLQAATDSTQAYRDGVWLVELAALSDAALVPQAVASVLGVAEEPDRPLMATLAEALGTRRLLLVLDNCEHLVDACALVADTLLRVCPALRILATSRQPLGIDGETVFQVPPLSLSACSRSTRTRPADDAPADSAVTSAATAPGPFEPVASSEAAHLFVERAQAARPAFTLTDRNVGAIEQLCHRLDGLPLAIELAAARVAVLSPEQIEARLNDRFRLLSGGSRTALPRYRTLRALVDWSHDRLDEGEQILLRRLAVFAGGWTLDAAEAVCADDGLAPEEILDVLTGLVEKSLVQVSTRADEVRYSFLETLREYAAEKLRDAGEEPLLRERHRDWFLALAERAVPELVRPHQEVWLDRLDRERENLRAAQRWAVTRVDAETMARLGAALWQFWWARADAADAREWITTIVPLARQVQPTRALAQALHGAGMLAGSLADYATCRSLLQEALSAARQVGDSYTLASVLDSLGRQLSFEGHYAEAHLRLNEALAILRPIDDPQALARALSRYGFLKYLEGDHDSARATLEEGLAVAHEAGDPAMVAEISDKLGQMFHSDGDLDGAVRAFQQAETIWRELGQGHWLAMTLNNLGNSQTLRGELGCARIQLAEALSLSQRMGNCRRMAFTLSSIATLAALEGDPERALRLDAVSAAAVVEMGIRRVPPKVPLRAQHLERARQGLGESAAAAAVAAGQTMTLAQAVEETLVWLAESADHALACDRPTSRLSPRSRPSNISSLVTQREIEVAAHIARGLTNRQIGAELVIAEGTVANHVKNILSKLGLDSRVQIAAWAVTRGLSEPASV